MIRWENELKYDEKANKHWFWLSESEAGVENVQIHEKPKQEEIQEYVDLKP